MAKLDVCAAITDQIVRAIESGQAKGKDWRFPWDRAAGGMPVNAVRGYNYHGGNILALWIAQEAAGYPTGHWATYRQWQSVGAQVRRGERGTMTVLWLPVTYKRDAGDDSDADGAEGERKGLITRAAWVFNAAQVDGWEPKAVATSNPIDAIAHADAFVAATGATIKHGGGRACYVPSADIIKLPERKAFKKTDGYYSSLFHELTHWTGAKKRLDRDLSGRFGEAAYAAEELVAELSAAFLCASLGISKEPRIDHAQYIATWLAALKSDKRAIFTAAGAAQKAHDYLHALQPAEAAKAA